MNFKQRPLVLRILLFPFSLLYGLVIIIRNFLYNKKIIRSATFNLPVICVGNLAVGGTGKSPMVEYLISLLQNDYQVATLSRGYKRKTKGYVLADATTTAIEIGDEPMQFHTKFSQAIVAVGEERVVAIAQLLHDRPDVQTIILDDAFQHRAVKAGLNILLTQYHHLYSNDLFLPAGSLRDQKASALRADIIVITKCPGDITEEDKSNVIEQLKPKENQQVYFTCINYGLPYHITTKQTRELNNIDEVLLVCGIANPQPLKDYIVSHSNCYDEILFNDHHIFSTGDMKEIRKKLNNIPGSNGIIITTEKDAVRLLKFSNDLHDLPFYVLPVQHEFLFNEGDAFNKHITGFIQNFSNE